jgi:Nif-specific regulatory protein
MASETREREKMMAAAADGQSQPCRHDLSECRVDLLPLLRELSSLTGSRRELGEVLAALLRILEQHMQAVYGMVALFDPECGRISIHDSFGLSAEEAARGIYYPGEGIVGEVVERGEPVVVPRVSAEPRLLDRREPSDEHDRSFLCVPIQRGRKVMGAICVERFYDSRRLLQLDLEILTIIAATTAQAVELHQLECIQTPALADENRRLQQQLRARFKPSNIIGNSRSMREVYGLIEKVIRSRTTVLILGESGVGKELVASAIHYNSTNSEGPFVRFNCAALPESVIESELFGHEKGSFTGAHSLRRGRFEEADGGTIFLDEIGEFSPTMQAKLLRVLQEKSFERVGGNRPIAVDIRIVAATNRDLDAMVEQGLFREDLYYRLSVFPIMIPPLRERGSDIVTLAEYFLARCVADMSLDAYSISTPALELLMSYSWPGNVRELENVIERAILLAEGGVIHAHDLPPSLRAPVADEVAHPGVLDAKLESFEYEMIVDALKRQHGNISEAADLLGVSRRILRLRMERHGLDYKAFRRNSRHAAEVSR